MSSTKVTPPIPPKSSRKSKNSTPTLVKYYLTLFNLVSAVGWAYLLALTFIHLFNLDGKTSSITSASIKIASSTLSRFFSSVPFFKSPRGISVSSIEAYVPEYLQPVFRRSASTYTRVGEPTAFVQSLAVLEIVHVLLGWVRSPLQTTAMQVASRLFLVWGILDRFPSVHSNPLFTSMILAWSMTEVIRYSFYACSLTGLEPYFLLYLRYTTFYILYPVGASSEAFLTYATLPSSSLLSGAWNVSDYFRGAMFVIWWPGLYIMYTYMITQRRKVLGAGTIRRKSE